VPTGDGLLYAADMGGDENWQLYWQDLASDEVQAIPDDLGVHHRFAGWSRDGRRVFFTANYRDRACMDLYSQEVPRGDRRLLAEQDTYSYLTSWSPDGQAIILGRDRGTDQNALLLVHLQNGEVRRLTPPAESARYFDVSWPGSRAGRYLLVVTDAGRDCPAVVELDLVYGTSRPLIESRWEIEAARLGLDVPWLAWVANEDGYSVLRVRDTATGRDLPLPELPAGVVGSLRWLRGGQLTFTLTTYDRPQGVWRLDVDEQTVEPVLTAPLAGISEGSCVAPELIRYRSFDGLEVPAYLYVPRRRPPGRRLPVVMLVHGGPSSQSRPGFSMLAQYFVQRGWAVLLPNVRGSSGYGKEYMHLDNFERRMDAVADLEAGWRWLVDSGIAENRLL
jgi:dipeptidyl aminopeptidase/acylaminoacyl peptidase